MSDNDPKPAKASRNDEPQLKPETPAAEASESTTLISSEMITVPRNMADLWLRDPERNDDGPDMRGDVIAVRRKGPPESHSNYNYLLTPSMINSTSMSQEESPEADDELLETEGWYWPNRVSDNAKKAWLALNEVASMKQQNLDMEDNLDEFGLFLIRVGCDKVDPLHNVDDRNWDEIGTARNFTSASSKDKSTGTAKDTGPARTNPGRVAKSKKSATIAVPRITSDTAAITNSEPSTISEQQMLEAILRRAKERPHWRSCKEHDYDCYEQMDDEKARAMSLAWGHEVLEAVFNYQDEPSKFSAEYGDNLGNIRLRFLGKIDQLSPDLVQSSVYKPQGPAIYPMNVFRKLSDDLEDRSAADLLALDRTTREKIVSKIVRGAPHTLHEDNWVLLLVLTLGTEKGLVEELDGCGIKVENRWYQRSCWKLLQKLKWWLEDDFPKLKDSELFATWEG